MRVLSPLSALAVLSLATSCVAPPHAAMAPPPPPYARAATPPRPARMTPLPADRAVTPPPPAASHVQPVDWRDWAQTPGDWRYQAVAGGSIATFGQASAAALALQCVKASREIVMTRYVSSGGPVTIRTSSLSRMALLSGDQPGGAASTRLAANDPLLDAMGFSRGRFVVEQAGAPPLVLPAWAEVERVVQDCRG